MPATKPTRTYTIPVEWTAFGHLTIEASSLALAVDLAFDTPLPPCDDCEDFRVRFEVLRANMRDARTHPPKPTEPPCPGQGLLPADEAWLGDG